MELVKPNISIEYCPKCNWMLRATYMAQEILYTFSDDIEAVTLIPSKIAGLFTIKVDNILIFDRKTEGGFIEIKLLKQRIRDAVNPLKNLGHVDRK